MPVKAIFSSFRPLFFAALLVLTAGGECAGQTAGQGDMTLVLKQVGDIGGPSICYINQKSIKIKYTGTTSYLVASAPKWEVMFCNDTNKKVFKMSFDAWLKHIVQMSYADSDWDRFNLSLAKRYDVSRFGRNLTRYKITGILIGNTIHDCDTARNSEYLVLEKAAVAKQACYIMQKAYSAPKIDGLPVEFINHRKKGVVKGYKRDLGGDDHWLSTSSIVEERLPASFFAYPAGFVTATKEADVLNDDKRKKHVDDMVKDLLPSQ
jgi:hypothetical protein